MDPIDNLCPLHPSLQNTIDLAFLKATYPQISYWVQNLIFIFKVQNPIYMCVLPLSKVAINQDFIPEVEVSIKHVINYDSKNITKSS